MDSLLGQRELFLSDVNNRETIVAIKANNGTYCLQNRIEKFPLNKLVELNIVLRIFTDTSFGLNR